jgi:hypothetical protein
MQTRSKKPMFTVVVIVIAALITDVSLNTIYVYIPTNQSTPASRLEIFWTIGIIYIIAQFLLLEFVKKKSIGIRGNAQLHLNLIHRIVTVVQYTLAAVFIFLISDMILTSSYRAAVLMAVVGVSYSLAIVMLALLAQRFFSWFRSNRNSVVLLYGLSSATLAINAALTLAFMSVILLFLSWANIYPHMGLGSFVPFITSGSATETLNYAYATSSIISFMLSWVATILILRHYSPKLGKIKYWVIVGVPLAFFLLQFLPLFPAIISMFSNSQAFLFVFYAFIPTFSKPIGGILFGIAFWAAARSLGNRSVVSDYMIISAYGFVLLFVSNAAIVLSNLSYPPFGVAAVSFMGLSSYMILVGIYSSAISISEDSRLRDSIRNFARKESRLLDSIGTAHMEQEIEKRVITLTKQNQDRMVEETGIQSSLTEEDMKQYLEEVINEVKKEKATTTNKTNNGNT